jgi:hypothetical protein
MLAVSTKTKGVILRGRQSKIVKTLGRSAGDELHNLRRIEDRAGEGTVFFVTDPGDKGSDLLCPV